MPKSLPLFPDPACRLLNEYGLLAAVLATPHDDLPRLVYADFLEEQNDPRGPFLRKWVLAKQTSQPRPKPPIGLSPRWMNLIGYSLDVRLMRHNVPRWAETVRRYAEPCILVNTRVSTGKPVQTGTSKLGGLPDLDPDTEWPEGDNGPAAFVAQWNLAELASSPVCRGLPKSGLLSFFIDLVPAIDNPRDGGVVQFIFTPNVEDLEEREPDEEREEANELPECQVEFYEDLSLLAPGSRLLRKFDFLDYATFYMSSSSPKSQHQILGLPLTTREYPVPDERKGWQLLTEFGPDENARFRAFNGGSYYFWVQQSALKQGDFDEVEAVFSI
jgi:uncharacterized protein (TIGR02996 family)